MCYRDKKRMNMFDNPHSKHKWSTDTSLAQTGCKERNVTYPTYAIISEKGENASLEINELLQIPIRNKKNI